MDPGDTLHSPEMGAHRVVGFEESSLAEEVQLKVGEERGKAIGIVPLRDLSSMVGDTETIGAGSERPRNDRFEQTGLMEARHGNGLSISFTEE